MWSPSGMAVFATGFLTIYSLNLLCRGERSGTLKLTVHRTQALSLHQYQAISTEVLMNTEGSLAGGGLDADLVFQCLGPRICKLVGSSFYYDPYKRRCVRQSIMATLKGAAKPEYPELRAACEKGLRLEDYVATLSPEEQSHASVY
eukprot:Gregarina_sp_Poly_1__2491@NODE_1675_length_3552_cov_321_088379_g1101_i0_p2_GENE_NODE_1675_length_3552_cov_321_088379_g1101_i0NODE_1675_length_3552_cov_321_088379_g1101_i0_p2_ORF_typecomplete_len146_score11_62_NODE_1675_length_3552_cov_321_088379_g1101_i027003137